MDEFLIELQAKLDEAKSKDNINKTDIPNLQSQLDKLKIQVELDPKAAQKLADSIGKLINQKIIISNIGINQTQLAKTGQQMGQIISDGAEKAISNVTSNSIGKYFKIDSSTSNQFRNEMEKLVKEWTNAKGKLTDVNIQIRTSYDEKEARNIERLHQATVTYKNEIDEVIKKTIAWRQIGTTTNDNGEEIALRGFVEVAGQYSKSIDTVNAKTDSFVEKQQKAVASAQNTISSIESKLNDPNISKSLAGTNFDENGLNTQLERVKSAISALDSANRDTFTQAQIDVDKEITSLNNLISTLKNAEYAATSLRTKDINTVKIDEGNNLNAFVQKMEQSGHYTDELKQKVENLRTQLNGVFDANTLTSYLNGLSNLQSEFKSVDATAKTLEKSTKLQANIDAEKKILQVYTTELKEAGVLSGDVKAKIQEMFHSLLKVDNQNGLTTWRAELKGVKVETDAVLKSVTQLSQKKLDEIQLSMDNGHGASEYQNRINSIIASLEKYGVEAKEAKAITSSLQSTFDSMKGLSGQELISQADKLEQKFKAVKVSVDQAKISYDKFAQPVSDEKISSLIVKINNFLKQNTVITKESKVQLENYKKELSGGSISLERWKAINNEFTKIKANMSMLDKLGKSVKDQFFQAAGTLAQYFSIARGFSTVFDQLRKMPKAVYEIDTAMTNLYKVTDETDKKYTQFLNSAGKSAYNLGRSVSSLVDQTANWAKLGFSLDEAEQLAKISSIYTNVGEVDNDTAVSDMVTAMKAFNIEASDAITIVDKLNKLGNEYATSAAALGDGLSRSASAMSTAGTDINKTLAMLTGGAEITQNATEFGNFLKIGSMRIRGMKGDLEALGEEVDETVDSISKVQTQILNRTGGKVNIFDDMGNFRDYYDIMEDISKIYNELSDPNKADLTEILFGKQRGNQGSALIQAFQSGQIQKALEATMNAEGSAMQEQERWMGSLEAKIKQLEAVFQHLSSTVLDSDLLKWFVDFGTSGVKAVDNLITKFNSLGTVGLGAGLFAGVKNTGKCRISVRIS